LTSQLKLLRSSLLAAWLVVLAILALPHPAAAQFGTPIVDGTIGAAEYGVHSDGQNQQTSGGTIWYMTWDATNLYVGISGANTAEGAVIYLDKNPIAPINGGTNADGTLVGQAYDGTSFAALQFRADVVLYAKSGYRDYRTADGAGGWSGPTTGFGAFAESAGAVREFSFPWSAIGGQPAAFNWFGYVTSPGGFVYGQVPTENSGGSIGTAARYDRYYTVSSTANGSSTKPFSRNSYVFNSATDVSGFGALSVYDFTMNSSGRTLTRGSGAWSIAGQLRVDAGTVSFGATTDSASVAGDVTITGGTLNLSTASGGDLNIAGNWVRNGGAFNHNNRTVTFNGSSAQTIGGSLVSNFYNLTVNNNSGVSLGKAQTVNGTLALTTGDLSLGNSISIFLNLSGTGGGISVSGARSITGSGGADINFFGAKTITGGTLTFGSGVDVHLSASVDFGPSVSTINGTLYINSGGAVVLNAPTYGTSSSLTYGTNGGAYARGLEWSASSGAGSPYNVEVYLNTILNYASGDPAANSIPGILQIDSGTFDMGNAASPLTIGGSVAIFGTLQLSNVPGGDLRVGGAWQNAGTFNHNSRTVVFNGSGVQQVFGSPGTVDTTFAGLTIANTGADTGGVWLGRNVIVADTLTLTDGMLNVQSANLILGSGATVSGGSAASMVVTDANGSAAGDGFLCKGYGGAGSFTFPVGDVFSGTDYSPATLDFTSGTFSNGQACVRVTDAKQPNNTSTTNYLTRYWTATQSGISSFSANTTFTYVDADIVGTESALYSGQWDGANWTLLNPANTVANTIGGTVSSFSDFTGAQLNALAITLASFDAQAGADRVVVSWETVSERDNAGFNLYRADSAAGPQTLLTYVPSQAPGSTQGAAYSYEDLAVQPGETYWYWLEDVSLDGATTLHGPVSATVQVPTAVTLSGITASAGAVAGLPSLSLWVAVGAGLALGLSRLRRRA
jgi:hypothetical protein